MNDFQPSPTQFTYTPTPPMISINATYPEGSRLDSLTVELNNNGATTEVFDAMLEFIVALADATGAVPSQVTTEVHDERGAPPR